MNAHSARIAAALGGLTLMNLAANRLPAEQPEPADASAGFSWTRCADLPDPLGLKGMYAGVSHGMVILAGGSNFPIPRSAGGIKTLNRRIFVRPVDSADNVPWQIASATLPGGLTEGAAVTTEHGVVGIAGQDEHAATDTVFLLQWDESTASVHYFALPSLPVACISPAAAYWQGSLYVAGGEKGGQGLVDFWRLDLAAAVAREKGVAWQKLPSWPGSGRFGATLAVLQIQPRAQIFIFGGRSKVGGPAVISQYLTDAHRYDLATSKWETIESMPYPAQLAAAVHVGSSQLAILGGSDGHDLDRIAELGESYRLADHIQVYDARNNQWALIGKMPLGVAGAAAIELGDDWMIAGGEYSPTLRTPNVYRVSRTSRERAR